MFDFKQQSGVKYAIIIFFALVGATSIAKLIGTELGISVNKNKAPQAASKEIKTFVASEEAYGATQNDFSIEFLKVLENHFVERLKKNVADRQIAHGASAPLVDIIAESHYVETKGKKLAVTNVVLNNTHVIVVVAGIVGKEFRRVNCMRDSTEKIPLTYGVCAEQINKTFFDSQIN